MYKDVLNGLVTLIHIPTCVTQITHVIGPPLELISGWSNVILAGGRNVGSPVAKVKGGPTLAQPVHIDTDQIT